MNALSSVRKDEAARVSPSGLEPGWLWSLWDMLKDSANAFIELGRYIESASFTPTVARELDAAGKALAFGLATASVFHSMRAVEIGAQIMGTALEVTFNHPINLAGWQGIVKKIEKSSFL